MALQIEWGHKVRGDRHRYRVLSFKSKHQLPLIMVTTILADWNTGKIDYGWVDWKLNSPMDWIKKIIEGGK